MPLKICYDNQADNAIVSADDSVLNLPPSNVQDFRLSRIYRGEESINFDITGNGSKKNIFQTYINLIQEPTDLTVGANWTNSGSTDAISTLSINGNLFTKITNSGAASGYVRQTLTASFTNLILTGRVTLKKGSSVGNTTRFIVRNTTGVVTIFAINPDWDNFGNSPGTPSEGALLNYDWIDSETLQFDFKCDVLANLTDDVEIRCYGSNNATAAEFTYWTEVQLIDEVEIIRFPFVDGTHTADVIDETQTLPDRCTIVLKNLEPRFSYDVAANKYMFFWNIDSTHRLFLYYIASSDQFRVAWQDGGSFVTLRSQTFDDGGALTNINQKIDLYISLDLVSGGISDSRLIVIPQESGALFEDSTWNATPDVKTSTFPTLSIGWDATAGDQADSIFEKIQIIEGLLVGTVTSSADADALLEDKKIIFEKEYMTRLTATDLLIANSTINDGDTITLRGNDWDSFNSGTPVDETIDYDGSDILTHSFTKGSYQYWRLFVNSSNVIDIGRIFLGPCYTTPGIAYLIPQDINSATKKTIVVSGQSYGDERYFSDQVSARWPDLTETEKDRIVDIFKTMDIAKPFFITYDTAGATLGTMYVTFDAKSLKVTPLGKRNLYTITAKFREEPK